VGLNHRFSLSTLHLEVRAMSQEYFDEMMMMMSALY
jgi:hypothetical protein